MKILKDKIPQQAKDCTLAYYDKCRGCYMCSARAFGVHPCVLAKKEKCPYLTTDPSEGV